MKIWWRKIILSRSRKFNIRMTLNCYISSVYLGLNLPEEKSIFSRKKREEEKNWHLKYEPNLLLKRSHFTPNLKIDSLLNVFQVTALKSWYLYKMVAQNTVRTYGVKQVFWFVEGTWYHRQSRQIRFFFEKTYYSSYVRKMFKSTNLYKYHG